MPYLLSLAAAVTYAVGALFVKRASDLGADSIRILLVSNFVAALCFMPLLGLGGNVHWGLWWQPLLVACCFIAGQWLTFLSLSKGDVSIATPVLGVKILMVAAFTTFLFGNSLNPRLWIGATLATLGVVLLNRRPAKRGEGICPKCGYDLKGSAHSHECPECGEAIPAPTPPKPQYIGRTILLASLAAASFAIYDVLVQQWSPHWQMGRFLPIAMGMAGLLSFVFLPMVRPLPMAERTRAWRWLIAASLAIGLQALLIVSTIAHWEFAVQANVVYSSRGVWSIVLIFLFGHLMHVKERDLGPGILAWRMAGAVLMMAAIILVLV